MDPRDAGSTVCGAWSVADRGGVWSRIIQHLAYCADLSEVRGERCELAFGCRAVSGSGRRALGFDGARSYVVGGDNLGLDQAHRDQEWARRRQYCVSDYRESESGSASRHYRRQQYASAAAAGCGALPFYRRPIKHNRIRERRSCVDQYRHAAPNSTGTRAGAITVTVAANAGAARVGKVTIGEVTATIEQSAVPPPTPVPPQPTPNPPDPYSDTGPAAPNTHTDADTMWVHDRARERERCIEWRHRIGDSDDGAWLRVDRSAVR